MEMTSLTICRWLKASTIPMRERSTVHKPPINPVLIPCFQGENSCHLVILSDQAFLTASRSPRMPVGRKIRTSTSRVKAMASLSW